MKVKTIFVFILLATVIIACNLTKAVHIDDTAYLEMAQAILKDPLHPLSQELNWLDTAEPIFYTNQPLLLPAILAVFIRLFGETQIGLHLLSSIISIIAVVFFYLTANRMNNQHALFLTCLFALGPAFLPGQNLMVDMPLMTFWLIFFWAILSARNQHTHRYYFIAALAVSAACLTKYTSLILLPIFLLVILFRRQWFNLLYLLIPIGTLTVWSIFNIFDYGSIHILARSIEPVSENSPSTKLVGWFAGLGSVSPFVIGFLPRLTQKIPVGMKIFTGLLGIIFLVSIVFLTQWNPYALYWAVFLVVGLLTFILAARSARTRLKIGWARQDLAIVEDNLLLSLWLLGVFAFIVLFSPFLAIRHIFLAIPPILLLLGESLPAQRDNSLMSQKAVSLFLTIFLGLTLAISDYYYADVYRQYAFKIRAGLPENAQVWVIGHWGWEWYARQAGMKLYDTQNSVLQSGDYVVQAENVFQQQISPADKLRLNTINHIEVAAPISTWLRTTYTDQWGGYYAYLYPYLLPWRYSNAPYVFLVYEVMPR